ncbi:PadR family transcriptional regulator [Roseivirga pacifica]|uniref:Transcriptional regulator PadR-like family protein n=1 Tax=Roseivirga pacifica TaxID=1267423 RepID=A0A1I0M3M8_9BACT|nr:PadR family transcriptional regulator [Roseivirga pacifica]RKQ50033.1 PadR family transcriptional regulator [Roseivirga pacifica]SEV82899.1 Transcriptional regulator PadR-like family protein [Roseivirga pacifica]
MSDYSLGTLEETILIIVLMKEESYGVEIAKVYESHVGQSISLPAIHVVLKRLEKKGLVKSAFGEPTPERGGKRKKFYQGTPIGYKVAKEMQERRSKMWSFVPNPSTNYGLI